MNTSYVRGDSYNGFLSIGQRVHCILYGGNDGIISAIHGEQMPETIKSLGRGCVVMGGQASVDVVFNDHVSRAIPESILRGVQWYISTEITTPDEILSLASEAVITRAAKKEEERKAKEARDARRKALPMKYPWLQIEAPGNKISGYALGAKNIKEELRRAFPGTKFSVRSEGYSGGCSIHVSWTDGPTEKQVEKYSGKYQEGNFNGMEDIYETNRENVWPDVFGGAKYVSEGRHESRGLRISAAKELGYILTDSNFDKWDNLEGITEEQKQEIYRAARGISCCEEKKAAPVKAQPRARNGNNILNLILAD